jgi:glycosyltransferase involved in cell wall biosynthesis
LIPKISACLIVRDEAANLEACLSSLRPYVDELVVVDTGSTDGSPEIARRYADVFEVFLDCNSAETGLIEDFAAARNRSFELASHEWVFWIDADDVLEGGENLRKLASEAQEDNVVFLLPYEYAFDADGRCVNRHYRERLMRPRSKMRWVSPVHEGCLLNEEPRGTSLTTHSDLVRVIHRSQYLNKPREPGRNLRILRKYVAKVGESDVRALYYLGLEYGSQGDLGRSLQALKRYVELSRWDDERCGALLKIAETYRTIGDQNEAIQWASRAVLTKSWAECYWSLTKSFYALAMDGVEPEYNFRRAAHFAKLGLSLKTDDTPDTVLFEDPRARFEIHDYLNVVLSRLGDNDGAIASCEAGLFGLPHHERMTKNLGLYRNKRNKERILSAASELQEAGALNEAAATIFKEVLNGNVKIQLATSDVSIQLKPGVRETDRSGGGRGLGRSVTGNGGDGDLQGMDDGQANRNEHDSRRSVSGAPAGPLPGCLDIVIYTGPALEPWNPETIEKTGIGGSETMAWEMAKRLAKQGNRVRVFGCLTRAMEGVFEGVEFINHETYRDVECDVLIASRAPWAVDDQFRLKAGCRILWVHDLHCGESLDHARDMRFDRILCLSEWHKKFFLSCYPRMNPGKIIVTRNGIDLDRFDRFTVKRDPHKAVYSSSPDRGLQTAIDCWPAIRRAVPDAELHVFYGWLSWETSAKLNNDEPALRSIRFLKELAEKTEGVFLCGRVDQYMLAREMLSAGVWVLPTWFQETSCISAMEAQAAGCRIVTSPIAALNETVGPRGEMIGQGRENEWRSKEYMEAFTEAVVEAMTLDDRWTWPGHPAGLTRTELQSHAREHFCLDKLAIEWQSLLRDIHADVTERVVPPFVHVEAAQ